MSGFHTIYRETIMDRMMDDGTYEECKSEAFEEVMDSKDRKDWINDVLITKIAEDYDLSHAVRKFTDEQKLDFFNDLLVFIGEALDDETDEIAGIKMETLADDRY